MATLRSTVGWSSATAALLLALACGRAEQSANHRSVLSGAGTGDLRPQTTTVETSPVSVNLTANGQADKLYVPPGSAVELAWTSVGAAFCVAPLGEIRLQGTHLTEAITEPTTFALVCNGANGTASAAVKVIPGDPPPVEVGPSDEPTPSPTPTAEPIAITRADAVPYGTGLQTPLLADIAYPQAGTGPFPGLILVHGGEWMSGTRTSHSATLEAAARRGYVAMAIDYRLLGELFPGQVEDVKGAVRWLRAHAADYRLDKSKIGIWGFSSGAQLAMLAAYSDASLFQGTAGNPGESSALQAVVNWSGPSDMTSLYGSLGLFRKQALVVMFGGSPLTRPDVFAAASPLTHVSAGDPPTWSVHGAADTLVPLSHAQNLDVALKAAGVGVAHTLNLLADQGHIFQDGAATDAARGSFTFLDAQLKPAAAP